MRRIILAVGALLAVPFVAVPASAEEAPGVRFSYTPVVVPFDSGYTVAVLCNTSADPGVTEDIPVATVVTCSVNGIQRNRGMLGREAFVTVNATVNQPVEVCISGQAAFVNPTTNDIVVASAGPQCEVLNV